VPLNHEHSPPKVERTRTSATRSRWRVLPADVVAQSCKRVAIMSAVIGSLWAIALVMNIVVAPLLGHHHEAFMRMPWPNPGNLISVLGLAVAVATLLFTARFHDNPRMVLNASHVSIVLGAGLVSVLMNWYPESRMGVSWLCLIIVLYPSIVPTSPLKTLVLSLILATIDPITIWISHLRGENLMADTYTTVWYFLPNYIAVALAVIPAAVIAGLGRQVNQARELGSYQLGELLGRGGMGEVYHAHHRMLARPAAVKLIRPEVLVGTAEASDVVIRRFRREAQAAAVLR